MTKASIQNREWLGRAPGVPGDVRRGLPPLLAGLAQTEPMAAKAEAIFLQAKAVSTVTEVVPAVTEVISVVTKLDSVITKVISVVAEVVPAVTKLDLVVAKLDPVLAKLDPVVTKLDPAVTKLDPVVAKLDPAVAKPVFAEAKATRTGNLMPGDRSQVTKTSPPAVPVVTRHPSPVTRSAFSLVEVLVVISLMSLIVLALMTVFNTTQRAFRASVTQTDVLEGSRAAVDLITSDLRRMVPSGGVSNGPVNFFAIDNDNFSTSPNPNPLAYLPLQQTLPGTSMVRTNVLNCFFLLGRENMKWIGVGYVVGSTNTATLYPLFRFYAETNIASSPRGLFDAFVNTINFAQWTNMSHLMDGVVYLTVRAYDPGGYQMTNIYQFNGGRWATNKAAWFSAPQNGEVGFYMFSNTLPAAVELQLGVLEDRSVQRAESLPNTAPALPPNDRRTLYLQGLSGNVHLFRQRVTIPNLDPTAYQ